MNDWKMILLLGVVVVSGGCKISQAKIEQAHMVATEAAWIRNGEPIVFEGASWYPQDDIENLFDNEVYLLGEYQGVEFYIEKQDVRPYNRLYTKFTKNKYRLFEKSRHD